MSDISLFGLAFFVVALGTIALGVMGLVVQGVAVAVLAGARRSQRAPWWRQVVVAVAGPTIAIALGMASALALGLGGLGRSTQEALDSFAWLLPLVAVALWIATQVALVRAWR